MRTASLAIVLGALVASSVAAVQPLTVTVNFETVEGFPEELYVRIGEEAAIQADCYSAVMETVAKGVTCQAQDADGNAIGKPFGTTKEELNGGDSVFVATVLCTRAS